MAAVLLVICAALAASPAGANTSRKVSLLRNSLITDDADIFMYPGAIGLHRNLVVLELGIDPFSGDGGLLVGWKKLTIGAFAHRTNSFGTEAGIPADLEEMLALYSDSGVPVQFELPAKIIDLLIGAELAPGIHFGMDILFAHAFKRDRDGSGDDSVLTGEHIFTLGSVLGLTVRREAVRLDLGFELVWNSVRDVEADLLALRTHPEPCFAIAGRLIVGEGRPVGWGLAVLLSRRNYGLEIPVAGEDWDGSRWIFRLALGPRVEIGSYMLATLEVFAEADLAIMEPRWSPPVDDEDPGDGGTGPDNWQRWNAAVPGLRIAAEIKPAPWIRLRGAIEDQYRLNWEDDTAAFSTSNNFTWALGLGLAWRGFGLDATIADKLFTDGPYFVTGEKSGLFSTVTVSYDW